MIRKFFGLFLFAVWVVGAQVHAQDTLLNQPKGLSQNVDSLIQDSLLQAFILNHRPLTEKELSLLPLVESRGFYGEFIGYYLYNNGFYAIKPAHDFLPHAYRAGSHQEWIFYSLAFLFLFAGLLNTFFSGYLPKLFRAYINDGFIFKQTREQMMQSRLVSFLYNVFFVLSGTLFIFLGLDIEHHSMGKERWGLLLLILGFLSCIYVFKTMLLQFLGWAFGMQEVFRNYLFVVFVTNKIAGFLVLLSCCAMAFMGLTTSKGVFFFTLCILALMVLFRCVKAYTVFSRQAGAGSFSFIMAFLSLELLPTAVLIKWISNASTLVFPGIL